MELLLRDKKCDHCSNCLFFEFGYFLLFAFSCTLVVADWRVFHFWFLHTRQIIARRYAAAKYRLHARMVDDKNNHRLQVCAKMNRSLSWLKL